MCYMAVYLILTVIILLQLKPCRIENNDELYHSLNSLRGLFALEIVLGHCVRYEQCILTPLGNFMLLGVGFFFFISGYGLTRSFHTKPEYMDTFIRHRVGKLCLIAIGAVIVNTIIAYLSPIKTDFRSIPSTAQSFVRAIYLRNNWYIWELMILYFVFYLVFKYLKKNRIAAVCILIVTICAMLYAGGYTRCWFASIFCFPAGILFYENKDRLTGFIRSLKGIVTTLSILSVGLVLSLIDYPSITGLPFETTEMIYSLGNNIMCIGFMSLLITGLSYFKPGNIVLRFLNSIATELYLFQFIFLAMAESLELNYVYKIVFVLTADIILSLIIMGGIRVFSIITNKNRPYGHNKTPLRPAYKKI